MKMINIENVEKDSFYYLRTNEGFIFVKVVKVENIHIDSDERYWEPIVPYDGGLHPFFFFLHNDLYGRDIFFQEGGAPLDIPTTGCFTISEIAPCRTKGGAAYTRITIGSTKFFESLRPGVLVEERSSGKIIPTTPDKLFMIDQLIEDHKESDRLSAL